jgi:hypothetical protein
MSNALGHYQQIAESAASPPAYSSVINDADEEDISCLPAHNVADRFNYDGTVAAETVDKPRYRDLPFAVMFIGTLVIFGLACFIYGRRFSYEGGFSSSYSEASTFSPTMRFVFIQLLVAAISGTFAAFFWVELIKSYPTRIMNLSIVFFIGSLVAYTAYSLVFMSVTWTHAVVLTALSIMSVIYFYANRSRFPLAAAMLQASSTALSANSGPVFVAICCAVAQIAWVVVWGIGAMFILATKGVITVGAIDPDLHHASAHNIAAVVFALFICFYWTWQVIMNVGHTTTAGAVAAWWLLPGYSRDATCASALRRSLTTSFGSICLGSLVVAVVQALRSTLRFFVKEDETSFAQCCLNCLLVCLESALQYFNHYAFTFVAVYGDSLTEAGTRTSELFVRRGFSVMVNDDISSLPLSFGTFVCGIATALVSATASLALSVSGDVLYATALVGFFVGAVVASVVLDVVRSAVSCTFVLWAELPAEMETVQPEAFRGISNAQKEVYGGV